MQYISYLNTIIFYTIITYEFFKFFTTILVHISFLISLRSTQGRLKELIQVCFIAKNDRHRYKYHVVLLREITKQISKLVRTTRFFFFF